eukprot:366097-Chlamydomonas_euryale.AAC.48
MRGDVQLVGLVYPDLIDAVASQRLVPAVHEVQPARRLDLGIPNELACAVQQVPQSAGRHTSGLKHDSPGVQPWYSTRVRRCGIQHPRISASVWTCRH